MRTGRGRPRASRFHECVAQAGHRAVRRQKGLVTAGRQAGPTGPHQLGGEPGLAGPGAPRRWPVLALAAACGLAGCSSLESSCSKRESGRRQSLEQSSTGLCCESQKQVSPERTVQGAATAGSATGACPSSRCGASGQEGPTCWEDDATAISAFPAEAAENSFPLSHRHSLPHPCSPRATYRGDLSLPWSPAEAGDLARPASSGTSVWAGPTSGPPDPSLMPLFR